MSRKNKKDINLGGYAVALGCLLRIVQLCSAYFGWGISSARPLYIAMLCLLSGGFAVLAYEKKGVSSLLSVAAAACSLLTTVMGNMSSGDDALRIASAVLLYAMFALSAAYMLSCRKSMQSMMCAVALGCVTIALFACTFIAVPAAMFLVLPIVAYAALGFGCVIS